MEGFIFSEDLCRLCLWRSNKLLPIFSEEGELQGIPLKIGMCLPISVTRDDVLPKLICSQCIYKLEMFSEFRNSCVRSEQLLKRYTTHEPPVQSCHTVVVQMQEELKAEVPEPDPIAIEPQVPYMCIIPEVQKPVEEPPQLAPPPPLLPLPPPPPPPPQPPQASVESTNTNIDTKEGIIPTKKVPKKKQKSCKAKRSS